MKNILHFDNCGDVESTIVGTLSNYPFLVQKDGKMNQSLFTYLMTSFLSDDKNIQIPKNSNPKVNLQILGQKVKQIYPSFDCELLYELFPERKEITASKLYSYFDEQNVLDLKFEECLDSVFEQEYLSQQKLKNVMKQMNFPIHTKKQMSILIDGFDVNKDGKVSRDDFMTIIQQVIKRKDK